MRASLITILTFLTFHIQAQNWIGSKNFIAIYQQSDLVVSGNITNINDYTRDTTSILSHFNMPLKSLTLSNTKAIKGNWNSEKLYYTDIFNGCGYAPILVENILDKETLIFAKIKNDSIFQIESMNEGVPEITTALKKFDKLIVKLNSENFTAWFYENLQNDALFALLNHNISFREKPLAIYIDSLKFSLTQRNWLYSKIKTYQEYSYENKGIIALLVKYKDNELKDILKTFIINLRNEPYSDVDELMFYYYQMTGKKELHKLMKRYNNDWRAKQRKKIIEEFINMM